MSRVQISLSLYIKVIMYLKGFFNFFCFLLAFSSFFVISSKNTIQSIISLIVCFIASSFLLLTLNCEFFAFLFLIVYVGAIAVLFLFVLMMLEIKHLNKENNFFYLIISLIVPISFFIIALPFVRSFFLTNPYFFSDTLEANGKVFDHRSFKSFYLEDLFSEVEMLGQLLYTKYALQFLFTGLILTLAVLCVGVLTINQKANSYRLKS